MTILCVDATNFLHQIFHANNGIGVIESVKNRIRALELRVRPSLVIAAFDRKSYRHDLYPEYKAGRPPKPALLSEILADAEEALFDCAELVWASGYEADDCLATVARCGLDSGERVVLATGDKDVRQCLVEGQVTQLRGFKTFDGEVCDEKWYTATSLMEEFSLFPSQWTSYQALCGDSGDNIPGAKGFGPKYTLACLKKCGTLAECLAKQWELPITPRLRANLAAFASKADFMLDLVTLRTDVEAVQRIVSSQLTEATP